MRREELYLAEILDSADLLACWLEGADLDRWAGDDLLRDGEVHRVMLIGEAARSLSAELRSKHPEIPWARIIGFRNIVIHEYFSVQWPVVWHVATEEVPALRQRIAAILEQEFPLAGSCSWRGTDGTEEGDPGLSDACGGDPARGQAGQHPDRGRARPRRSRRHRPEELLYTRDPSLDPQLVWDGKDAADADDLRVTAPPLYIQEKIDPQVLVENLRRTAARPEDEPELRLFEDFDGLECFQTIEYYRQAANWSNRMIVGDSLQVMGSLAGRSPSGRTYAARCR